MSNHRSEVYNCLIMEKKQTGRIAAELISFSIPLILSGVFQQLYSWADALIVGNFAGENALAAVGTTTSPYQLLLDIILGATSGITILSARYYGAHEAIRQRKLLATFLRILTLAGVLMAGTGMIAAVPLLNLLKTPALILDDTVVYLRYLYAGIPFLAVYNTYASILRGCGNSRAPFLAVMISGFANIILDYILVNFFHMGVAGAGLATFLTQALMAVYLAFYARCRYAELTTGIWHEKMDAGILQDGMHYAVPLMIQGLVSSGGKLVLTGFRNGFGVAVIAAVTTAYRVDTMLILPIRNLAVAISTMVSQKIGSGHREESTDVLRAGLFLSLLFEAVIMIFVMTEGGPLIGLFGVSAEAESLGARFFRDLGPFYAVFGLFNGLSGYLQGFGDVRYTSGSAIASLGLRIFFSYTLVGISGWEVIAYADGLGWCGNLLFVLVRYWSLRHHEISSDQV